MGKLLGCHTIMRAAGATLCIFPIFSCHFHASSHILYSLGLYELGIDAADALPPLKPTSCSSDWIGYNPRSNFRYETGHGNDKAEKARAPIRQGHVEGSRCAREERVRYPWEAVRADQPNAPPGSSAEPKPRVTADPETIYN